MYRALVTILSTGVLTSNLAVGKTFYTCHMSVAEKMSDCCCYPEENQEINSISGDQDACKLPDCMGQESESGLKRQSHGSCCTVSYQNVEAAKSVFQKTNSNFSRKNLKNLFPVTIGACEKTIEQTENPVLSDPPPNLSFSISIPVYILTHAFLC